MQLVTRDIQTTPPLSIVDAALKDEHPDKLAHELQRKLPLALSQVAQTIEDTGLSPVDIHHTKLGPRRRRQPGETPYWVWDREGYRVLVNNTTGARWEVPQDATLKDIRDALEDYLWDMGCSDETLSRHERKEWEERGAALLDEGAPIPRMTDDDLRQFVLDYVDGYILTDRMLDTPDMLGMVFVPMAFGGLTPDEDKWALLDDPSLPQDPGEEPRRPPERLPTEPMPVPYPAEPDKPSYHEPDPAVLAQIQSDIDWERREPEAVADYLAKIEQENELLREEYQAALAQHQDACLLVDEQNRKNQVAYMKAANAYEESRAKIPEAHSAWAIAKARHDALVSGFLGKWTSTLGVIYEHREKAMTGRVINGYPIFFSCRLMHRDDWDRVAPIIRRERDRRQMFTLDDQPDPSDG